MDFKIHDTNTFLLHEVVEKNKIDSVKWIFRKITNEKTKHELVLKQNSDKNTALHLAYQQGNKEIAQYILQQITDRQTNEKLFQQKNTLGKSVSDYAQALNSNDTAKGSKLNAKHGLTLAGALLAGYDCYQFNHRKTKKNAIEKKNEEKPLFKKKSKETVKTNKNIAEQKTGIKAYLKAIYVNPMKHKKALIGFIIAAVSEWSVLTQ